MATSVACYLTPGLTWQIWQVGLHCCTRTHKYSEQQQNVALEICRLMCYPCKCSRRKLQRQLPHKQIVIRGCRELADNSQAVKSHLCNSPSGLQSEWACTQTDSLCRVTKSSITAWVEGTARAAGEMREQAHPYARHSTCAWYLRRRSSNRSLMSARKFIQGSWPLNVLKRGYHAPNSACCPNSEVVSHVVYRAWNAWL